MSDADDTMSKLREQTITGPRAERFLLRLVRVGYLSVDPDGVVWQHVSCSARRRPRLTPSAPKRADTTHATGYRVVRIMNRGRRYVAMAHRLVFRVLIGSISPGYEINHKDGVKSNNRPDNLEVVTHLENMRHAFRSRLVFHPPGEAMCNAKLTDDAVRLIRAGGSTSQEFATRFGVTRSAVNSVIARRTWRHVK